MLKKNYLRQIWNNFKENLNFLRWTFGILAVIEMTLIEFNDDINPGNDFSIIQNIKFFIKDIIDPNKDEFAIVLIIILMILVFLSTIKNKIFRYIGYSIPSLILVYGIFDYLTCNGVFCDIRSMVIIFLGFVFLIIFRICSGQYKEILRSLINVEIIFILITTLSIAVKFIYDY